LALRRFVLAAKRRHDIVWSHWIASSLLARLAGGDPH
jgi:hypothetical protein